MRVRWVIEDAGRPGGVEAVTNVLVDGLQAAGHDATVVSWFKETHPEGRTTLGWFLSKLRRAWAHRAAARRTAQRLRRELEASPDLVVVLDPGSMPVAVRLMGAPRWGIHLHWSPDLLLRPWQHLSGEGIPAPLWGLVTRRMRSVGRRNERILAGAPFLVTLTPSHTRAMQGLRADVLEVPNPARLALPAERPTLGTPPHVAYLGRVSHEKGPDLFVRTAAASGDRPDIRWSMAGAGPAEVEVRALAGHLKAPISFLGWVDSPRAFLETVDVFVLPSRTEAVPLVLAEALTAGCHVVATDAGEGVRDALDGGSLGRLVPVDDVSALVRAVAQALSDRAAGEVPSPTAVAELARRHDPANVFATWERLVISLAEA